MCTTLNGVNVIDIRVNILRIVGIIHHCHLDRNALFLCLQIDDIVKQMRAMTIYITHKFLQSVFCMEHLLTHLTFLVRTHVGERYGDASIQICQFPHSLCNDVILVCCCGKHGRVWPELLSCTTQVGSTYHLHRIERLTLLIFLLIYLPVPEDLRQHSGRKGVNATYTHTMQSTADLVRTLVELSTSVQHCHHDFKSRLMQFLVLIHGNTTSIVLYGY